MSLKALICQKYFLSAVLLGLFAVDLSAAEPVEIGSRRELFVDTLLVEDISGKARLQMHHPVPREEAIRFDADWEGSGSGYHTVFQDGDLYRMYYRGLHLAVSQGKLNQGTHPAYICYAESTDGIHWTKPELGLFEHNGSKANNIVLVGKGTHNFTPFLDTNPECPAESKYKGIGGLQNEGGLFAFHSPDGIHWSLMREEPIITKGAFDSQNLAFWDTHQQQYRAYYRIFTAGVTNEKEWKPAGNRAIRTGVSEDFLNWSKGDDLTYLDSPPEQLYTNQIKPYYRAPHILIGFPARYVDRGWTVATRGLPQLENRELRASSQQRYGTAITEGLLMASRDGVKFKRWNEAWLRPGISRPGVWQYAQQFIAWHIVETASALDGAPPELSIYATEDYWHGRGAKLRRYSLRLDGFVSIHGDYAGGIVETVPVTFTGSRLLLNYSTSAAGGIRIALVDPDGKPYPGFSLEQSDVLFGDSIEQQFHWKGDPDLAALAGKPVRLRFELKDADVFAFQFGE